MISPMNRLFCMLLMILICVTTSAKDEDGGLKYLKEQFPKTTEYFSDNLEKVHATYIFAVDVSGSMGKYADIVQPALSNFVSSLPEGDFVRIIKFGTEAYDQRAGFFGTISQDVRRDLRSNIGRLYNVDNEERNFKQHTDIKRMTEAIVRSVMSSSDSLVYVFILTDFRNDQEKVGECQLKSDDLKVLNEQLRRAAKMREGAEKDLHIVTLELPVDKSAPGYCLAQLRNAVFQDFPFETQSINSSATLTEWFTDLRKNIWTERLRSLIRRENHHLTYKVELDINIDGKVRSTSHFDNQQGRMYTTMSTTQVYLTPSFDEERLRSKDGFYLISKSYERKGYKKRTSLFGDNDEGDTMFGTVDMGNIYHLSWGLRYCTDTVVIHTEGHTEFDDELERLDISTPSIDNCIPVNRLIFTFFMPFWVCCVIVLILTVYIILVIKAMKQNLSSKYNFSGRVEVMDVLTREKQKHNILTPLRHVTIGGGATECNVRGVQWKIAVEKKTFLPLTLRKPILVLRVLGGKVINAADNWKMPQMDVNGQQFEGSVTLKCGTQNDKKETYKVTIYSN